MDDSLIRNDWGRLRQIIGQTIKRVLYTVKRYLQVSDVSLNLMHDKEVWRCLIYVANTTTYCKRV
jgi:hypothetical protein